MVAHARGYLAKRWAVLPLTWIAGGRCSCGKDDCGSPGKHPLNPHGCLEPITTGLGADLWWDRYPLANVGIVTGAASGICVLDVDPRHGGTATFRELVTKHGFPRTPKVQTGGGGTHIYFASKGPIGNRVGAAPGLDVRGDNGYVVAPPSNHESGGRYEWAVSPVEMDPAPAPPWFLDLAQAKARNGGNGNGFRGKIDLSRIGAIPDGQRNDALIRIVGRLIWEKADADRVHALAAQINAEKCSPPLTDGEVEKLVTLALRRWS